VLTSGGVLGKVTKVSDDYVTIEVAEGVELNMQKSAVAAALPKGTIKSI
jgi:preprotein translocase subunit YajC